MYLHCNSGFNLMENTCKYLNLSKIIWHICDDICFVAINRLIIYIMLLVDISVVSFWPEKRKWRKKEKNFHFQKWGQKTNKGFTCFFFYLTATNFVVRKCVLNSKKYIFGNVLKCKDYVVIWCFHRKQENLQKV